MHNNFFRKFRKFMGGAEEMVTPPIKSGGRKWVDSFVHDCAPIFVVCALTLPPNQMGEAGEMVAPPTEQWGLKMDGFVCASFVHTFSSLVQHPLLT